MFGVNKKSNVYQSPRAKVVEVDLEGLVCSSVILDRYVDELKNVNTESTTASDPGGSLYFEF